MYSKKPNVELVLVAGSHKHPYLCPLSPSSLNFFLEELALLCRCFALGFASPGSRAAARARCMPRDCHTLLSNKTIFSPLCLKPLVIIYLKHAQMLALRHVSGNGKSRASMCLRDPCPAFARL